MRCASNTTDQRTPWRNSPGTSDRVGRAVVADEGHASPAMPRREQELIPEALMVRMADRLRILGQPVRLRLEESLGEGSATPRELSDALGLSRQNISKHLLSLHRAGIVSRRLDGSNVFYTLTDPSAATVLRLALEAVSAHLRVLADLASGAPGVDTDVDGEDRWRPAIDGGAD